MDALQTLFRSRYPGLTPTWIFAAASVAGYVTTVSAQNDTGTGIVLDSITAIAVWPQRMSTGDKYEIRWINNSAILRIDTVVGTADTITLADQHSTGATLVAALWAIDSSGATRYLARRMIALPRCPNSTSKTTTLFLLSDRAGPSTTLQGDTSNPSPSTGTAPPTLANYSFDDTDFSFLDNFPQGTPRHRASTTGGIDSTPALEVYWNPSAPDYSPAWVGFPAGGHRFVRVYFRLTAPMLHNSSNIKVFRFSNPNRGAVFSSTRQAWAWGFDQEGSNVMIALGIFEKNALPDFVANVGAQYVYGENIADDDWHWLEIDFDRGTDPQHILVRFWFDGRPIVMPNGKAWAADGYWWRTLAWQGGSHGEIPSTLVAPRSKNSSFSIDNLGILEEMSGGITNTGSMFVDNIAISSRRIGP